MHFFAEALKQALRLMNGATLKNKGYQCPHRASRAWTGTPASQMEYMFEVALCVIAISCISGKSRSPCFVVALLLAFYHMAKVTPEEAYEFLIAQRLIVEKDSDDGDQHRDPLASRGCFALKMSASMPCKPAKTIRVCISGKNRSPYFLPSLISVYYHEHMCIDRMPCDS